MTRTEQFIREWLSNPEHIHIKDPVLHSSNGFDHMIIRDRFELSYGGSISIQQGATHRCDKDSVELWYCPHRPILEPYGCPDEYGDYFNEPYSRVPISVLADYVDELESGSEVKAPTAEDWIILRLLRIGATKYFDTFASEEDAVKAMLFLNHKIGFGEVGNMTEQLKKEVNHD